MSQLVVEEVSLRFGGVVALDGLSFTVEPGQVCGLIGPNGAGKTTLFNCVNGIYRADRGRITLDDTDLLSLPAHRMASNGVARTFQNLGLFPSLTFVENVVAGAHARGSTGFLRALSRVGVRAEEAKLRGEAMALLDLLGLHDLAHQRATDQPYGTLKRLELARALAVKPRLLLLDEPAGGLTHSEVDDLAGVIKQVREHFDLTILLVEHHMGMVMSLSDTVVAMNLGRKIVHGTPDEVRRDPEVIRAYLGSAAA